MNTFFELLRVAIGLKDSIESVPSSREEWEALYKVVGEHNLLGVTFPVIDELHDETEIPLGVYTRWAMVSQKIEKKNENHRILCRELYNRFAADGLRSCIFKGQAAALRYPRPELRQSGDIDIWIEGETKATVEYLKARYNVKKVFYHHCDTEIFEKKKGVEVHLPLRG